MLRRRGNHETNALFLPSKNPQSGPITTLFFYQNFPKVGPPRAPEQCSSVSLVRGLLEQRNARLSGLYYPAAASSKAYHTKLHSNVNYGGISPHGYARKVDCKKSGRREPFFFDLVNVWWCRVLVVKRVVAFYGDTFHFYSKFTTYSRAPGASRLIKLFTRKTHEGHKSTFSPRGSLEAAWWLL